VFIRTLLIAFHHKTLQPFDEQSQKFSHSSHKCNSFSC